MCIRDRAFRWGRYAVLNLRAVEKAANHYVEEQLYHIPTTCLLYTSDAADERSSVDLGGRGIIKKKTKKEYHVMRVSNEQQLTV